jgi:signal transduction histidine kinase
MNRILLSIGIVFSFLLASGQDTILFTGEKQLVFNQSTYYIDSSKTATAQQVREAILAGKGFTGVLDLDYTHFPVWVCTKIINQSNQDRLVLIIENPLIDSSALFLKADAVLPAQKNYLGEGYNQRSSFGTYHKFTIPIALGDTFTTLIRVTGTEQMLLPLTLQTEKEGVSATMERNLIYGIFIGVILVMFFYNLFVLLSTRDSNYLYYILYILFIGLGQTTLSGHFYALVLGEYAYLHKISIVVLPALSGVAAVLFIQHFLQVETFEPKLNKGLWIIIVSYGLAAIVRLLGQHQISARMMDSIGLPGAALVYVIAIRIYKRGVKSALYFIIAWSVFILGVVFFVLRNLGIMPLTPVTTYTLPVGAAMEVALLSFALANKINTLQSEKSEKEREVMIAMLENERLVREQNEILEHKVKERTTELYQSNAQLSEAITNLRNTQTQLVEQEKMASLGQLTAGIAHEINNPINFVTSNINPLKRDIKMLTDLIQSLENLIESDEDKVSKAAKVEALKEELDYEYLQEELGFLLKGIDDGAHRTSEIVKGLRIFARQDEDTLLEADLIEGINSTLVILNNQLAGIKIERNTPQSIMIQCYPGKLNQVFLNLLSNAIYAIHQRHQESGQGLITISVQEIDEQIKVVISDNGTGMTEEVKNKVFEPFFTTKPVGDGTGLGMSIVFKTIEMHQGKIIAHSEFGVGTTFEIHLKRTINLIHNV